MKPNISGTLGLPKRIPPASLGQAVKASGASQRKTYLPFNGRVKD